MGVALDFDLTVPLHDGRALAEQLRKTADFTEVLKPGTPDMLELVADLRAVADAVEDLR